MYAEYICARMIVRTREVPVARRVVTNRLKIILPTPGVHECKVRHLGLQTQQRDDEGVEVSRRKAACHPSVITF